MQLILTNNRPFGHNIQNMKKNILFSVTLLAVMIFSTSAFSQEVNKLTKKEKKAGWTLLFNGKNFDGWRQCNGTAMPTNCVLE